MNKDYKSEIELEILVSTMNRNSLDFLESMFQNNDLNNHTILIVNQTSKDIILYSSQPNIRVINSFERGLSKSRNLAIKNAEGHFCLIADDDVVFLKGFQEIILDAFKAQKNTDVITFKTSTTEGKPYYKYPNSIVDVKKIHRKILSIEIAFNRKAILSNKITFDENFGLGSTFEDGENFFFLNDIFLKKLKAQFTPEFIVIHEPLSSSDEVTSDRYIYARSAMYYKSYGMMAYLYIIKLIFSLLRRRLISFSEIIPKFKMGIKGIEKYKQLKEK